MLKTMMLKSVHVLAVLGVSLQPLLAASTSMSAQLEQRAAQFFKDDQPGGVVLVRRGNEILLRRAYGLADLENQLPLRADGVFPLASATKQFTSLAVLKLVESGKLSLDQRIGDLDPSLPKAIAAVSVRQLLTHTSGIKNISSIEASRAARRNEADAQSLIGFFGELPLEFPSGSQFRYSNSNYIVLTRLIEVLSAQSYPDYLRKTIFEPLGMHHTRYGSHVALVPGRVHGYQQDDSGAWLNAEFISMSQPQGAGGLLSNVDDLARWDAALSSGKLVDPKLQAQAFQPVKLNDGSTQPYGFGWVISEVQGSASVEHGGFINGFNSQILRIPEQQILVTVLTNAESLDPADLSVELAAIALGQPYDKTPAAASDPAGWLGRYQFAGEVQRDVLLIDGRLHSQYVGADPIPLLHAADDRYYLGQGLDYVRFAKGVDGQPTMTLHERFFGDSVGVQLAR